MAYPTIAVKVSLSTDPFATPSYTTLPAADVQGLDVVRGRKTETAAASPGRLSVPVDSSDRRYDPRNTAGSHYGDLTPGKGVQVTATYNAVTYELFNGWVDGWPQDYQRYLGRATLEASGALKWLARATLGDPYADAVAADNPVAWYRFSENAGTVIHDNSGNGHDGTWMPELADANASGLIASADGAVELPAAPIYAVGKVPAAAVTSLNPITVEFWVKIDKIPVQLGSEVWAGLLFGGGVVARIYSDTQTFAGSIQFAFAQSQTLPTNVVYGETTFAFWAYSICDGKPHHVVCTYSSAASDFRIWVDGTDRSFTEDISSTPLAVGVPAWGPVDINYVGSWGEGGSTVLDELAFYDQVLSESQVLTHLDLGLVPWTGDATGARVGRILDLMGWPAGLRSIDTGNTVLGTARWPANTKVLAYLQNVVDTEHGRLDEAHHDTGKVWFRDRNTVLGTTRSTTSQQLFSDDPVDLAFSSAVAYSGIELATDDKPAANVVTVRWVGGDVTVQDSASIAAYGEIPLSVTTLHERQDEASNLAAFILDEQANTFDRIRRITVIPSAMTGTPADLAWPAVLGLREGDRIRVKHTPANVGSVIDQQLWIEGIEHHAKSGIAEWRTSFFLSPASSTAYWVLDTSALDSTTVLAY